MSDQLTVTLSGGAPSGKTEGAKKKKNELKPKLGGELSGLKGGKALNEMFNEALSDAGLTSEYDKAIIGQIASGGYTFSLDINNPSYPIKDLDALKFFGAILRRMNRGYDIPDLEDAPKVVEAIRACLTDFKYTEGMDISDDEIDGMNLTPRLQAILIRSSLSMGAVSTDGRMRVPSNDIMTKDPNSGVKIVLSVLHYDVSGVVVKDREITVFDNRLMKADISTVISAFGQSRYALIFTVPGYGDMLKPSIVEIQKKYGKNTAEYKALASLMGELDKNREEQAGKEEGLTEAEMTTLRGIMSDLNSMPVSDENDRNMEALDLLFKNLRKVPGLSDKEVKKLQWLVDNMGGKSGVPGEIIINVTEFDSPEFKAAMEVLQRISQDIAAIATVGIRRTKGVMGYFVIDTLVQELKSPIARGERNAMNTGAPIGVTTALKGQMFPKKVARLDELSRKLFGEGGKRGTMGDYHAWQQYQSDKEKLEKAVDDYLRACIANHTFIYEPGTERNGFTDEKARLAFLPILQNLQDFEKKNKDNPAVNFGKGMSIELAKDLQEYNMLLQFFTTDEINGDFLLALKESFPEAFLNHKFAARDPFSGAVVNYSLNDIFFGENGMLDKFISGEYLWPNMNIVVGEGSKAEKIAVAKQILSAAIDALNITKEVPDYTGPATYLAVGYMSPGADIFGVPLMGQVVGSIASAIIPAYTAEGSLGTTYGATSWEDLRRWDETKYATAQHILQTSYKGNFNYGAALRMLILENSTDSARVLIRGFAHDAIKNMNIVGAEDISDLVNVEEKRNEATGEISYRFAGGLVASRYEALNKNPEAKKEVLAKLSLKELNASDPGFRDIKRLNEVLKSHGLFIELMEKHMPFRIFTRDANGGLVPFDIASLKEDEVQAIQKGVATLRNLTMDLYAIKSAIETMTLKNAKKPMIDPVQEAILTAADGTEREIYVLGTRGKFKAPNLGEPISAATALERNQAKSTEFKYLMRYQIAMGFYMMGKAAREAYKAAKENKWMGDEGFWAYMGMSGKSAFQTGVSFALWEMFPPYALGDFKRSLETGDWNSAIADLGVTGQYAFQSVKRDYYLYMLLSGRPVMGQQLTRALFKSLSQGMLSDLVYTVAEKTRPVRGIIARAAVGSAVAVAAASRAGFGFMVENTPTFQEAGSAVGRFVTAQTPTFQEWAIGLARRTSTAAQFVAERGTEYSKSLSKMVELAETAPEEANAAARAALLARNVATAGRAAGRLILDDYVGMGIFDKLVLAGKSVWLGTPQVNPETGEALREAGKIVRYTRVQSLGEVFAIELDTGSKLAKAANTTIVPNLLGTSKYASAIRAAGVSLAALSAVIELRGEIKRDKALLYSSKGSDVAEGQSKLAMSAIGGWLMRPIIDLAGKGVGIISSRAGKAVSSSYDDVVGWRMVSGTLSPVYWAYRSEDLVGDGLDYAGGWAVGLATGRKGESLVDKAANALARHSTTRNAVDWVGRTLFSM